jgi:hypothetical protein
MVVFLGAVCDFCSWEFQGTAAESVPVVQLESYCVCCTVCVNFELLYTCAVESVSRHWYGGICLPNIV